MADAHLLQVYRHENGLFRLLAAYGDETEARIEPFEEVVLDVKSWWV